jgi:hypothetical protein
VLALDLSLAPRLAADDDSARLRCDPRFLALVASPR